jgi:hypothetical protein
MHIPSALHLNYVTLEVLGRMIRRARAELDVIQIIRSSADVDPLNGMQRLPD